MANGEGGPRGSPKATPARRSKSQYGIIIGIKYDFPEGCGVSSGIHGQRAECSQRTRHDAFAHLDNIDLSVDTSFHNWSHLGVSIRGRLRERACNCDCASHIRVTFVPLRFPVVPRSGMDIFLLFAPKIER